MKFYIEVARGMLDKAVKNGAFSRTVLALADEKFVPIRDSVLKDFDEHKVTQELKGGVSATNITGTLQLGKRSHRQPDDLAPNLTTFLGLENPGQDLADLRNVLDSGIFIKAGSRGVRQRGTDKIRYGFSVFFPSQSDLGTVALLPWGTGGSWARAIENGVSGLGQYIYWKLGKGRSGGGYQTKRTLRPAIFTPINYLSGILERLKQKIK